MIHNMNMKLKTKDFFTSSFLLKLSFLASKLLFQCCNFILLRCALQWPLICLQTWRMFPYAEQYWGKLLYVISRKISLFRADGWHHLILLFPSNSPICIIAAISNLFKRYLIDLFWELKHLISLTFCPCMFTCLLSVESICCTKMLEMMLIVKNNRHTEIPNDVADKRCVTSQCHRCNLLGDFGSLQGGTSVQQIAAAVLVKSCGRSRLQQFGTALNQPLACRELSQRSCLTVFWSKQI